MMNWPAGTNTMPEGGSAFARKPGSRNRIMRSTVRVISFAPRLGIDEAVVASHPVHAREAFTAFLPSPFHEAVSTLLAHHLLAVFLPCPIPLDEPFHGFRIGGSGVLREDFEDEVVAGQAHLSREIGSMI